MCQVRDVSRFYSNLRVGKRREKVAQSEERRRATLNRNRDLELSWNFGVEILVRKSQRGGRRTHSDALGVGEKSPCTDHFN